MLINSVINKVFCLAFISTLMLTAVSCQKSEQNTSEPERISLTSSSVNYDERGQFLKIEVESDWVAEISFTEGDGNWCSLNKYSGTGQQNVWLSYSVNNNKETRAAVINIKTTTDELSVTLYQLGKDETNNTTQSSYLELPEIEENGNLKFVTHHITLNGQKIRNYSILYDTQKRYPVWVAYPMHSQWIGNSGRTDNWQYDPLIDQALQPNMFSGMKNGYDRGHMLPSASRLVTAEANYQTFYFTNMTAQMNSFNAYKWMETESKVRGWSGSGQDTLYVVTGAVLQTVGGNETVKYTVNGNDNVSIPVPNYYYKVVMKRVVKNSVVSYRGIGLWFTHAAASGVPTAADAKSIDWIEQKTGINFFSNLEEDVQQQIESVCNTSEWGL